MNQFEDDNIPDPNEFVFNDDGSISPKLLITFMGNMSRNMGSISEAILTNTKQMDSMQSSLQELLKAETDRRLEHQETLQNVKRLDARVDDRKAEAAEIKAIAIKAHERIDEINTSIDGKCDSKTKESSRYTDKSIKGVYIIAGSIWAVSAFLIGIILSQSSTTTHDIKDNIIRLEDKIDSIAMKNAKTYINLEEYKKRDRP